MKLAYNVLLGVVSSLVVDGAAAASNFDKAVGFALTGADGKTVKIFNRKQCVFRVAEDTFYLNNIDPSRTKIAIWKQGIGAFERKYTTVELHGEKAILERIVSPVKFDESTKDLKEFHEMLKAARPDLYEKSFSAQSSVTLTFSTTEVERLRRAWNYIYQNGCEGSNSSY